MLKSISIQNFRGLKSLSVDGLGRVNLVVGKNEAGKTALAEAVAIGESLPNALSVIATLQARRDRTLPVTEFEDFWRPLFWRGDVDNGLSFRWERDKDGQRVAAAIHIVRGVSPVAVTDATLAASGGWSLELSGSIGESPLTSRVVRTTQGVQFPLPINSGQGIWVGASSGEAPSVTTSVQTFSRALQAGRYEMVLDVAKSVDDRITRIEVLAPTGAPRIYVWLKDQASSIPFTMMGDGFQKCIDIATSFGRLGEPAPIVDEIENGLHYSLLPGLWRWIAKFTATSSLQLFATTHSEECIAAACRAFSELADDGLRVVRLDRHETGDANAVVYDRGLVETAVESGVEIRG